MAAEKNHLGGMSENHSIQNYRLKTRQNLDRRGCSFRIFVKKNIPEGTRVDFFDAFLTRVLKSWNSM